MLWHSHENTTLICNSSGCISIGKKNNWITHTFLELLQFQETWNLIGQDKVGHAWQELSRKNKTIGCL